MIKLFRNIRYSLMENNKSGKYLRYAFGEIVLVVIGILIALQINNWNVKRLEKNQQLKIYERVLEDIDNDISELSNTLTTLNTIKPVFEKVVQDSVTPELLDKGISRIIMGNYYLTSLNKTGVSQLKETTNKDSLAIKIIETYDLMENIMVIPHEKRIMNEIEKLTNKLRTYPWFAEWMSKTIMKDNSSKELQDYFLYSLEYKNSVIFFYQQLYNNYYSGIQLSIASLTDIRKAVIARLDE